MANYFLAKTDPETYSIDDLVKEKDTTWDGVHNFQAINIIKEMKKGDFIYVYHSGEDKCVIGLMQATSDPRKNEKDSRPSWVVDVKFLKKYKKTVSLADFKSNPKFKDFKLVTHSRLSVMEVTDEAREFIEKNAE